MEGTAKGGHGWMGLMHFKDISVGQIPEGPEICYKQKLRQDPSLSSSLATQYAELGHSERLYSLHIPSPTLNSHHCMQP